MNITPLIDVVFLLIVFFMIVNNIVTDDAPPMQLPTLEKPQAFAPEGERRVVINVVPVDSFKGKPGPGLPDDTVFGPLDEPRQVKIRHLQIGSTKWELSDVTGLPVSPEKKQKALEDFRKKASEVIKDRFESGSGRPPLILLRCDAALKYEDVYPVLTEVLNAMGEALSPDIAAATPIHIVAYIEE